MYIENLLRQQDEFARRVENFIATQDHGRGLEGTIMCPTCERPTVLVEHEYTPQLSLHLSDNEPEREGMWFSCDWCGSEIDTTYKPLPSIPRKPATGEGETDTEWARRVA